MTDTAKIKQDRLPIFLDFQVKRLTNTKLMFSSNMFTRDYPKNKGLRMTSSFWHNGVKTAPVMADVYLQYIVAHWLQESANSNTSP
jgi:hypothetical protein